jgi:hypothetical protein
VSHPRSWHHWPKATYDHVIARRPDGYADALARCIVKGRPGDAEGFWVDHALPAWGELVKTYAAPRGMAKVAHGAAGIAKAIVNADPVPDDVLAHRRATCEGCNQNTGGVLPLCRWCDCVLRAKTKLARESCPLGLWAAYKP